MGKRKIKPWCEVCEDFEGTPRLIDAACLMCGGTGKALVVSPSMTVEDARAAIGARYEEEPDHEDISTDTVVWLVDWACKAGPEAVIKLAVAALEA